MFQYLRKYICARIIILVSNITFSRSGSSKKMHADTVTSIVDLENQGQTYFQITFYYLRLNTCYRLDFTIDYNIIEVMELEKSKINNVAMMTDLENNINFEKIGLTLKIKVNHQGQVTDFGFSEILNIVNVRIDTKIESIACIQPEISKVIEKCV